MPAKMEWASHFLCRQQTCPLHVLAISVCPWLWSRLIFENFTVEKKVDIYRNLRYNVFVSCYERKTLLPRILFLTYIWGLTMKNRQAKSLFRNERSRCLRARQGYPRRMPIGFVSNLELYPPPSKFSYSLISIAGFKICDI